MIRFFVGLILGIFLFLIMGSILLEEFPELQPLWEEFKSIVVNLYNMSVIRYGAITTFFIIVAILILFGTNKKF